MYFECTLLFVIIKFNSFLLNSSWAAILGILQKGIHCMATSWIFPVRSSDFETSISLQELARIRVGDTKCSEMGISVWSGSWHLQYTFLWLKKKLKEKRKVFILFIISGVQPHVFSYATAIIWMKPMEIYFFWSYSFTPFWIESKSLKLWSELSLLKWI